MCIFDDDVQTDGSAATNSESHARFLNRTHTPYWESVRQVMEDWFTRLCPDAQTDVRSRLQSDDNHQFRSAFWELYLHEMLLKSGYDVKCHPRLTDSSHKPDFLAVGAHQSFYLEAHCMAKPDEEQAAEKRKNQLLDTIQIMDSPNFYLDLEILRIGRRNLSLKQLRSNLQDWLARLDPDNVSRQIEELKSPEIEDIESLDEATSYAWIEEDWHIVFRPIPKSPTRRGKANRKAIIAHSEGFGFMDGTTPFRKAVAKKGKAYGKMDHPFVVAIATSFAGADEIDVSDALHDSTEGYYGRVSHRRHQNVSGVLVVCDVVPDSVTRKVPILWEHPEPTHPVATLPTWGRVVSIDGKMNFNPPQAPVHSLFGLPAEWPIGQKFEQR